MAENLVIAWYDGPKIYVENAKVYWFVDQLNDAEGTERFVSLDIDRSTCFNWINGNISDRELFLDAIKNKRYSVVEYEWEVGYHEIHISNFKENYLPLVDSYITDQSFKELSPSKYFNSLIGCIDYYDHIKLEEYLKN